MRLGALEGKCRKETDALIRENWGGPMIVSRGKLTDTRGLPGLAAEEDGRLLGYLLYRVSGKDCEVVVLEALEQNRGVGTALLDLAGKRAKEAGCNRLWQITTNDNAHAIRF